MTDYETYEALVFKKAGLEKECKDILVLYIHEFGELTAKVFEKEIACIQKKKTIAFCQAAVNKNERIDSDKLNAYLDNEMAGFKTQLKNMLEDVDGCKKLKASSDYDIQKSKAIYRRLAKQIHPDLNPDLYSEDDDFFHDIWVEIVEAYHINDVKTLVELEVRVNKGLKDRNIEITEPEIEDLEMKISFLEAEIEEIISTDPYLFKDLLEDEEAKQQKIDSLNEQLKEYSEYEEDLNKVLQTYLINGVEIKWNPNS